jgi:hypothetical protein
VTRFSILRDILALDDVSAQQKLVLIALNQYGDDDGRNIYPATETIAKLASLSTRQTKRHVRTLRERGYLSPHGLKGRNNTIRYALSVPTRVTPASWPTGRVRPTTDPHNNNPLTIPEPVARDSISISISNQDSQAVPDRRAIHPISEKVRRLIEAEDREQAERKARLALRPQR